MLEVKDDKYHSFIYYTSVLDTVLSKRHNFIFT